MAESRSGEGVTYVRHDCVGNPVYVRRGEAEQAEAGADEAILTTVVVHEPITMVAAVVFDGQKLMAMEQIWTP